jgi:hypothetical protein
VRHERLPVVVELSGATGVELTRRRTLRLAGVVVVGTALAACTTASNTPGTPSSTPTPTPGGPDDPDAALRLEVAAAEQQLEDLYAAAARRLAAKSAAAVTALGVRHTAYRTAVSPNAAASVPSPAPPPATASAALTALRAAETAAATQRIAQAVRAHDPELARTLVLVGAGAAAAAEALRGVRA